MNAELNENYLIVRVEEVFNYTTTIIILS